MAILENNPIGPVQQSDNTDVGVQNAQIAQVTIGAVNYDQTGAYSSLQSQMVFADYRIRNRYGTDRHIYMGGVTSPGGFNGNSVAFVQLTAPTQLWICEWTAASYGVQPNVPDPFQVANNWVLLDIDYEVANVDYVQGQTPIYRISGVYVYGNLNPQAQPVQDVNFPLSPEYDPASAANYQLIRTISLGQLQNKIISAV